MIDIHSHILHGVDDGARDRESSLAILKLACRYGTTTIVATPHVPSFGAILSWDLILKGCSFLAEEAKRTGLNIAVLPGAEVMVDMDILDVIEGPGKYSLNCGKYILVELPNGILPEYMDEFLFGLKLRELIPVIAHPERYYAIATDPQKLIGWVQNGALIQINAGSLLGHMGKRIKKIAEGMLINNLVHCIASDAHGIRLRRPVLDKAAQIVGARLGKAAVQKLFVINPQTIIENEEVAITDFTAYLPVKQQSITSWLKKIFS